MGVYGVDVAVSTGRPPRADAWVRVEVESANGSEAELIACQVSACNRWVVMPVASVVTDWPED